MRRLTLFAFLTLTLASFQSAASPQKPSPIDFSVRGMGPAYESFAVNFKYDDGNQEGGGENLNTLSPFDYTRRFTVKVNNNLASLFLGGRSGGHGTGFYVGTKKDKAGVEYGIIFTNRHVVNSAPFVAQRVTIDFTTDTHVPETVDAKIEFQSQVHDFAVLLFKMSDLKRVREQIAPAKLPTKDSPFFDFAKNGRQLQGRSTMAQGNPFSSEASTTFGHISTVFHDRSEGTFIQTQTPINPGNSGGPLIDLETGLVIGINTQKITDADNIGFSIPVGVVLAEYTEWMRNPNVGRFKELKVRLGLNPKSQLDVLGVSDVITQKYPDFFDHFDDILRIHDADPSTNLRVGDQIVQVNGRFLASPLVIYQWLNHVLRAEKSIQVELVRNGKMMTVEVPVQDAAYRIARSEVDFVYISGLVFQTFTDLNRWRMGHHFDTAVYLAQIVPNAEINFGAMRIPDQNSLLLSVNINNQDYKIQSLAQLRHILYQHRDVKFMRLDVQEPVTIYNEEVGRQGVVMDPVVQVPVYRSTTVSYVVPVTEVLGPMQFSIHDFRKQYSFSQSKPETRDWRRMIRADRLPSFCEDVLSTTPTLKTTARRNG